MNRELVRRYWNDQDPVGKILSVNPPLQVLPKSVIEEGLRAGISPNYEPDKFTVIAPELSLLLQPAFQHLIAAKSLIGAGKARQQGSA